METFINSVEDMQWLKDVHVHNMPDTARSAVIVGNEDAPDSIAVYDSVEPLYTDVPILYNPAARESNRWLRDHNIKTNNTEMRIHDGRVIVRLYSTDIAVIDHQANTITLDAGGYKTVTTKARMNEVLRAFHSPYRVYQHDFQWYVGGLPFNGTIAHTLPLHIKTEAV